MRVALINPNRYHEPPVIPVGIEYIAHYLDREGHDVRVVDLCFTPDPEGMLVDELDSFRPDVVGFSLRNSDTCLYHDSVFFLDDYARLMALSRRACGAKVVIGGTGLLPGPREVAEYLGCDHAVYGPGERAFPRLLAYLEEGVSPPCLIDGWESSFDREEVPSRGRWLDYAPYMRDRGVTGFVTQTGCTGGCGFCLEAELPCRTRDPRAVVEELGALVDAGCVDLHLCDSEFNQELEACKELLRAMIASGLRIPWSLYMKPLPHDDALMRMLAETGADSVTLSVDSDSLLRGSYSLLDLQSFMVLAGRRGLKVAVDLLVGFPSENIEQVRDILDFFRGCRPDTVGVNAWIRLYKYTRLGQRLRADPPPVGSIEGGDADFLKPVFYNWLGLEELRGLIGDDPLFRVEGLERRSNYERLH
ncbi:MAG: cobalamin-dependent protein [Actinomycetota bacterium]|nr:cobalamin-dependent protein [Actinomycetota bacterium]